MFILLSIIKIIFQIIYKDIIIQLKIIKESLDFSQAKRLRNKYIIYRNNFGSKY